jgi:predicted GTPase
VDLVDPLDWNGAINMPSKAQAEAIAVITRDRHDKLQRYIAADCPVVAYSAQRYYNLQALFTTCLKAAPKRRQWMFELLKSFSTRDWLAQAKGLSAAQRAALAEKYIASDAAIPLEALGG